MITKGGLAIRLSMLKTFKLEKIQPEGQKERQKVRDEQYSIDAEIAAAVLWDAFQTGDIAGKRIADLGCGTGILGIGALLLGAERVFFVDKDAKALEIAMENLKSESSYWLEKGESLEEKGTFYDSDVCNIEIHADTAIFNPPFGTKIRHSDRVFVEKACKVAKVAYSLHKSETLGFIEGLYRRQGFMITKRWDFNFPLKATMSFHKRRIYKFRASFVRAETDSNIRQ